MSEIDVIMGAVASKALTSMYKKRSEESQEAFLAGAATALANVKVLLIDGKDVHESLLIVLEDLIEQMGKADK